MYRGAHTPQQTAGRQGGTPSCHSHAIGRQSAQKTKPERGALQARLMQDTATTACTAPWCWLRAGTALALKGGLRSQALRAMQRRIADPGARGRRARASQRSRQQAGPHESHHATAIIIEVFRYCFLRSWYSIQYSCTRSSTVL
jgi:hypothetical protein